MGSGHFRAFYELMISACMSKINRILFGEAAFGGAGPEWGTDWADTDKRMATGIDFKEAPGLEVFLLRCHLRPFRSVRAVQVTGRLAIERRKFHQKF